MTYEEALEILNSKNNIPYPKLINIRQNIRYANLLYNCFAGEKGELTTILQYTYEQNELKRYEEFSKIILKIAIEEMKHLNLISELIKKIGGKVYYIDSKRNFWNSENVRYHFKNIYEILEYNINMEKKAINEYRELIKYSQNKSIKDMLERIVIDEQIHLEIFNRLK